MGLNFGTSEQQSQSTQSSSSSSNSQATSKPVDLTPEAFQWLQSPLAQSLLGYFGGGNGQMTPGGGGFGGGGASGTWADYGKTNFAVPLTANESTLQGYLMNDANPAGARQSLIADTQAGKYVDPNQNPFLNDYIKAAQRPTLQGLEETLTRSLPSLFTKGGHMIQYGEDSQGNLTGGSSPFVRAGAIASRGAADAIGDIATKIGMGAYEQERGIQNASIKAGQDEVQTTIANFTVQGLKRTVEQYGVDKGLEVFQQQMQGILDALKVAASITQPTIGQESQSTSESESKSKGKSTSSGESFSIGASIKPTTPGVG